MKNSNRGCRRKLGKTPELRNQKLWENYQRRFVVRKRKTIPIACINAQCAFRRQTIDQHSLRALSPPGRPSFLGLRYAGFDHSCMDTFWNRQIAQAVGPKRKYDYFKPLVGFRRLHARVCLARDEPASLWAISIQDATPPFLDDSTNSHVHLFTCRW